MDSVSVCLYICVYRHTEKSKRGMFTLIPLVELTIQHQYYVNTGLPYQANDKIPNISVLKNKYSCNDLKTFGKYHSASVSCQYRFTIPSK